jgi:hypothetical protein
MKEWQRQQAYRRETNLQSDQTFFLHPTSLVPSGSKGPSIIYRPLIAHSVDKRSVPLRHLSLACGRDRLASGRSEFNRVSKHGGHGSTDLSLRRYTSGCAKYVVPWTISFVDRLFSHSSTVFLLVARSAAAATASQGISI